VWLIILQRIDQSLKFHTNIRERIRKSDRRRVRKPGMECIPGMNSAICCQGKLPAEVEEQIFALASATSSSPTATSNNDQK
jgi:hypothetical protein